MWVAGLGEDVGGNEMTDAVDAAQGGAGRVDRTADLSRETVDGALQSAQCFEAAASDPSAAAWVAAQQSGGAVERRFGAKPSHALVVAGPQLFEIGVQPVDLTSSIRDKFTPVAHQTAQILHGSIRPRRTETALGQADSGDRQCVAGIGLGAGALTAPSCGGHVRGHLDDCGPGAAQERSGGPPVVARAFHGDQGSLAVLDPAGQLGVALGRVRETAMLQRTAGVVHRARRVSVFVGVDSHHNHDVSPCPGL